MESETPQQSDGEALFAEVFRRAPDVMSIVRVSDAVIFEINDAFEEASGYTRAQIVGRSSREFPWWPSAAERDAILDKLRTQGHLQDVETRFATPAGEMICVISARPIHYRGERCAIWRAANVTEQRNTALANRALEERLLQKQNLEQLGLLAGGIAHDFNNLLVGVLGNAELVLSTLEEGSVNREPLASIALSAQRLAEHTRELLDYAGHTAVKLELVRLDVVLAEAAERCRRLIRPAIELHVPTRSAEELWIHGDAGQLARMFIKLIKNAAEALDDTNGSVWLTLARAGERAEVTVRDSGRGLDEAARAHMFDPFFSNRLQGHGLGLASVPAIVERHAGTVAVASDGQHGTSVTIQLPLQKPAPPSTPPAREPVRFQGRALVVDDEAQVRAVARAMLARFGFDVVEAEHGMAALALVQQEPGFELVVLDANMPGLNGAETLERLRALQPQLPVLLCSGYSVADFSHLLEQQPRTGFLTKPFRVQQLASAISALLRG